MYISKKLQKSSNFMKNHLVIKHIPESKNYSKIGIVSSHSVRQSSLTKSHAHMYTSTIGGGRILKVGGQNGGLPFPHPSLPSLPFPVPVPTCLAPILVAKSGRASASPPCPIL